MSRGSTIPQAPIINLMKFLDYSYLLLTASHYAAEQNFIPTATYVFVISSQYFTRFHSYRKRKSQAFRISFNTAPIHTTWILQRDTGGRSFQHSIMRTMKSENAFFFLRVTSAGMQRCVVRSNHCGFSKEYVAFIFRVAE
jgi:hypothetical protein